MSKKEFEVQQGLDEVEKDEELELDGILAVGGGRDLFLIVAPSQEAGVDAVWG